MSAVSSCRVQVCRVPTCRVQEHLGVLALGVAGLQSQTQQGTPRLATKPERNAPKHDLPVAVPSFTSAGAKTTVLPAMAYGPGAATPQQQPPKRTTCESVDVLFGYATVLVTLLQVTSKSRVQLRTRSVSVARIAAEAPAAQGSTQSCSDRWETLEIARCAAIDPRSRHPS